MDCICNNSLLIILLLLLSGNTNGCGCTGCCGRR